MLVYVFLVVYRLVPLCVQTVHKKTVYGPVDGRRPKQTVVQHSPYHKLIADAILETAVDLRTTVVGVE